jgi:Ca2+-binding EF-hand superfamily protein
MSSQFTKKAMVHVSGAQTVATLCDGREGNELKFIARRLQTTLNLTPEQIDDYYDAFQMFPLDSNQRISASSIQIFYENSDINLSQNDAMNALSAFLGTSRGNHSLQGNSIDFELFVINLEKWMKKVLFVSKFEFVPHFSQEIHHAEVLKMACTIYDEDGPNEESLEHLLVNIDGPHLSQTQLSLLAETMNNQGSS